MASFLPVPGADPTLVTGYRAPEDQTAEKVVVDMKDRILLYMPEATPFLTLTGKIKGKRMAKNVRFEWLEKDQEPRRVTVVGAQTDVDTTIEASAADVTKLSANDVLRNVRTGEIVLVGTPGTTDFAATRGIGGQSSAMLDGDVLVIIGNSYPDNSLAGTFKSIQEYPQFNFTQIFRRGFGFSGRDIVTEFYGGDDVMNETKWQSIRHKRDIEYALLFGKRHTIAAAGANKRRTFTGGVDYFIQTNRWDVTGKNLTKRGFDDMLAEGLRYGNGGYTQGGKAVKYLLHSAKIAVEINSWAEAKLEYRVLDKSIGFVSQTYNSPFGTVHLLHDPLLDEFFPDRAFLLDFNHLDYTALRKRDTRLVRNIEENDRDGEAYEYRTDCGLEMSFEKAHVAISGWGA